MSTQLKIFLLGMMIASSMAFTLRTKGGQHDAYTQKTTKTTTNECVCEEGKALLAHLVDYLSVNPL